MLDLEHTGGGAGTFNNHSNIVTKTERGEKGEWRQLENDILLWKKTLIGSKIKTHRDVCIQT